MYDAYHEILMFQILTQQKSLYSCGGYICEADTFGFDRKLNEVKEGGYISF